MSRVESGEGPRGGDAVRGAAPDGDPRGRMSVAVLAVAATGTFVAGLALNWPARDRAPELQATGPQSEVREATAAASPRDRPLRVQLVDASGRLCPGVALVLTEDDPEGASREIGRATTDARSATAEFAPTVPSDSGAPALSFRPDLPFDPPLRLAVGERPEDGSPLQAGLPESTSVQVGILGRRRRTDGGLSVRLRIVGDDGADDGRTWTGAIAPGGAEFPLVGMGLLLEAVPLRDGHVAGPATRFRTPGQGRRGRPGVDVVLSETVLALEGRLEDTSGRGVEGMTFLVRVDGLHDARDTGAGVFAETDATGAFRVEVDAAKLRSGRHTLEVVGPMFLERSDARVRTLAQVPFTFSGSSETVRVGRLRCDETYPLRPVPR